MSDIIAVDTNVLVYLLDQPDSKKYQVAERLVNDQPMIASQTVSEFINVARRILKIPKIEVLQRCNIILEICPIIPLTNSILQSSERLIRQYDLQIFDAIIVASALEAGCGKLYTEDMQHGLVVENNLHIVNPFL
jgi:predicted nucleic acid-binding protein